MTSRIIPSALTAVAVAAVCAGAAVASGYGESGDEPSGAAQAKPAAQQGYGQQRSGAPTQSAPQQGKDQQGNDQQGNDQQGGESGPKGLTQSRLAYTAYLNGQAEVDDDGDDAGDPRAKGSASFLQANKTTLCYGFQLFGAGTPTAVHIHKGAEGENGPPVIAFDGLPKNGDGQASGDPGASSGCKTLTTPEEIAAARRIRKNPGDYYLNFHTQDFPEGAVRGQLSRLWYNAPDQS
jgi:hypothetical protein